VRLRGLCCADCCNDSTSCKDARLLCTVRRSAAGSIHPPASLAVQQPGPTSLPRAAPLRQAAEPERLPRNRSVPPPQCEPLPRDKLLLPSPSNTGPSSLLARKDRSLITGSSGSHHTTSNQIAARAPQAEERAASCPCKGCTSDGAARRGPPWLCVGRLCVWGAFHTTTPYEQRPGQPHNKLLRNLRARHGLKPLVVGQVQHGVRARDGLDEALPRGRREEAGLRVARQGGEAAGSGVEQPAWRGCTGAGRGHARRQARGTARSDGGRSERAASGEREASSGEEIGQWTENQDASLRQEAVERPPRAAAPAGTCAPRPPCGPSPSGTRPWPGSRGSPGQEGEREGEGRGRREGGGDVRCRAEQWRGRRRGRACCAPWLLRWWPWW
jgi:hypothetical protein